MAGSDGSLTKVIGALRERRCPQRPSLGDRRDAWQLDAEDRHAADPHICYLPGSFRNWLFSGYENNRVVNWEGVGRERVREFSACGVPGTREGRSSYDPRRSHGGCGECRTRGKPLRILAETKEPRDLSAAGFIVNWSVAPVRNPNQSSPNATLFISSLSIGVP